MKTNTVLITGILVAAGLSASAFAGKDDKVDVCHISGNATGHVISVSGGGLVAHILHGDPESFIVLADGSCAPTTPR